MKKWLKIIERVAALAAVFFLPTQLALHFWPSYSFVFGIRVDYLSPAIYFTDILVAVLLAFYIVNDAKILKLFLEKYKVLFISLILFALLNTIFSTVPLVSLYKWSKFVEYAFFGIYIYFRKDFLGERPILKAFLSSSVLVSLIGILQFFLGRTTGLFYYLGERSFSISTPGIALSSLNGELFLRAYSTFSHPNSLAGYLGVVFILFLFSKTLKRKIIWYLSMLIILFAFILTFSLSAYIALGILFLVYMLQKTKIFSPKLLLNFLWISLIASMVLPIYSEQLLHKFTLPQNIEQRLDLSYVSGKMAGQNLLLGEGLNTFVVNSVKFKAVNIYLWLLQPVHNIFLLVFTEAGLIGLILFVLLFYFAVNQSVKHRNYLLCALLFFILFTSLSDHYWFTMQQNLLLWAFVLGFKLRLKS